MAGGVGGPQLAAGELRQRIAFLTPTRVDDRGFGTTTWTLAFSVWAAATPRGGVEEQTQDRGALKLAADFDVRYRSDITSTMRVAFRGSTYEIIDLVPLAWLGRLTIRCIEESALAPDHITITPASRTLEVRVA